MKPVCCSDAQACDNVKRVVEFLKIIAEENRLKILCMLSKCDAMCVSDIWQYLAIPQNLTSHHLKVLKDFGLIAAQKRGLNVFYALNNELRDEYKELVDRILTKKGST